MSEIKIKSEQNDIDDRSEISLDSLSFELFEIIVNNLKLETRLRLRSVSKLWLKKVENLRIKKLFISDRSKNLISNKCKPNRNEFNLNYIAIHPLKLELFISRYKCTILCTLKCLGIYDLHLNDELKSRFDKIISSLSQLESLILYTIRLDNGFRLDLPGLKSLEIYFDNLFSFELVHPESIELIQLSNYNGCLDKTEFKNLKFFFCMSYYPNFFESNFLANLPSLEELHLDVKLDRFKKVYEQKQKLKRNQLKIYNNGILINDPNEFGHLFDDAVVHLPSLHTKLIKLCGGDYSRLANKLLFFYEFNYTAVESAEIDLPLQVLDRYDSIDSIFIHEIIKNDEQFLKYMTSLKRFLNLSSFLVYKVLPSSTILNRLPNLFPYLQILRFRRISKGNSLNLDWIFKLKYLIDLESSFSFKTEFIGMLFKKLKYLNYLKFVGLYNSSTKGWHDLQISKSKSGSRSSGFKLQVHIYATSSRDEFKFDNISTVVQVLVTRNLI